MLVYLRFLSEELYLPLIHLIVLLSVLQSSRSGQTLQGLLELALQGIIFLFLLQ